MRLILLLQQDSGSGPHLRFRIPRSCGFRLSASSYPASPGTVQYLRCGLTRLAKDIGAANENGIRESDILLAVLDGAEVDSGCAAEIGFAMATGKRCFGLRTDWRDCGEFGLPVNLQLLHFIEKSGGTLFRRIEEIEF